MGGLYFSIICKISIPGFSNVTKFSNIDALNCENVERYLLMEKDISKKIFAFTDLIYNYEINNNRNELIRNLKILRKPGCSDLIKIFLRKESSLFSFFTYNSDIRKVA